MEGKQFVGVVVILLILIFSSLYVSFTVETKVDNRFKAYDALFLLDKANICLNTTSEEVKEYYLTKEGQITPLGLKWSRGEYLCKP